MTPRRSGPSTEPTVRRYLAARAPASQVDDLAAETFLIAWRRAQEMPPHVLPWLLNVAAKLLANQRRSADRADALVERLARVSIRIERDLEFADAEPGASPQELRNAPTKTVTVVRDVYVRHDDALPVRVVDHVEAFGNPENTTSVSEFSDVQKLTLDASTERTLELADHPGAKRTVQAPFEDR